MMDFSHNRNDALYIPQHPSGDRGNPGGRDVMHSISPFENTLCTKPESKIAIIREEFVELTGDPLVAVVLNQLIYWSQRVTDFDLYIEEEKRSPSKEWPALQYGWFRKTNPELMEETMLHVTVITFRRYMNCLVKQGWVQTRIDPRYKWNRNPQYRVNLRKLCADLQKKGYSLPDFESYEISPNSPKEICIEQPLYEVNSTAEGKINSKERQL